MIKLTILYNSLRWFNPSRFIDGLVWHEQPKLKKDKVLKPECDPVNISPTSVLSYNARQDPHDKCCTHSLEKIRNYDRDGRCTV